MKYNIKTTFNLLYIILFSIGLSSIARAADNLGVGLPLPGRKLNPDGSIAVPYTGYQQYIGEAYSFAIKAGGVLTVLMIIYAGYKYMTSQGNPSAIGEAKDIIIGSLSGFALLLLSYLILKVLGIPVT